MIQEAFRLEGKIAIVIGCDIGLGQGMAMTLAEVSCDVVDVNRKISYETVEKINALDRRFMAIQANPSQQDALTSIATQTVSAFGRVDILVNNAGIIRRQGVLDLSEKGWDDVTNPNLRSVFFLSQAVARQFLAQGNSEEITNIALMFSFRGGIHVFSYTASENGVLGITRLLANRWAAKGTNVNAIAPGYIMTNNTQQLRTDSERNQKIIDRISVGY